MKTEEWVRYAELAVRLGVNVQPGQTLVISAPVEAASFVRKVAEVAYQAGAHHVTVDWHDEEIHRLRLRHAPEESLSLVPEGKIRDLEKVLEQGGAILWIAAPKPGNLRDISPKRITMVTKVNNEAMRKCREFTLTGRVNWSIVAFPTIEWAARVFPDLPKEEALDQLWECIKVATRLKETDPIKHWKEHVEHLEKRVRWLNEQRFVRLHYQGLGTDLTIDLPEGHRWMGGGLRNGQGAFYIPNLPTEEVFTSPLKTGVNGIVQSTKPLCFNGQLIECFSLRFQDGRVVEVKAEKGEELLQKLIEMDEGAGYLGEVALVPHDSPISQMGVVFQQTLFDENASCHLALGAAMPFCLEGGTGLSKEELVEKGLNHSLIHIDFMIGSSDLNIDGETEEGKRVPVFRNGCWAD
jgi:aminopeptidase